MLKKAMHSTHVMFLMQELWLQDLHNIVFPVQQ